MLRRLFFINARQTKLTEENAKFRKAMSEYEATIQEMTTQMEKLRGAQIEHNLLEDELKTLAATLGRVQEEKAQMEKDMAQQKSELEEMSTALTALRVISVIHKPWFLLYFQLINFCQEKNSQIEIQLKESLQQKAGVEEKIYQEKLDSLEHENEKLTKQMLKHMRSTTELSETVTKVTQICY